MNSHNEEENKNTKRRIVMMIIILIIIILALLTNCSCTSNFFGRIGDFFKNEGTHTIKPGTNEKEIITNKDLKFDLDNVSMSISDSNFKLSFSYQKIVPDKFTCTTSDASIATCYVKDGHVVIIPKKEGTITVTIKTETNDKIYEATSTVTITKPNRFISLSKKSGTIDLSKENTLKFSYFLNNLSGKVRITSSDYKIATAKESNGIITITAKKRGTAKITVTLEYDGKTYSATFNLKVIDNSAESSKSSDSYLKNLTTSKGVLNFKKDVLSYTFTVINTKNITLNATLSDNKAKISYEFNGKLINNLNDLELKDGENTVIITVTAEDGTKTKYTVNINSLKMQDAYLSNIKVDGKNINFDKNTNEYNLRIPFNQDTVKVEVTKDKNTNNIEYIFNGKKINESDLNNLKPIAGNNTLIINITSNTGSTNKYQVNIYKPTRKVELNNTTYDILLGSNNFPIEYFIYEDNNLTNDYNLNDIEFLLEPNNILTLNKDKGFITVTPNGIIGTTKLTIKYGNIIKEITINVTDNNYYITTAKNKYDMILSSKNNKRDIIFNTNVFTGNIDISNINGGIRLTSRDNKDLYIDIITSDTTLIESIKTDIKEIGATSIPITVTAKKPGVATITATIHNGDKVIKGMDVTLNIKRNYIITLDANGGIFNSFTKVYEFALGEGEHLNLNDRNAFDEPFKYVTTSCEKKAHPLLEYNTKKDASGIKYSKDKVINFNDLDSDLTLYAIYDYSKEEEKEEEYTLWITDIPLFHNEEYFNKYNEDKVIYPGASGYYIANIINETDDDITLTSIDLKEETICVSEGCLNMGYIIKYNNGTNYYMGNGNTKKYELLTNGKDSIYSKNIPISPSITIKSGEDNAIDLTFFWKWIEVNDTLDTKIGNEAYNRKDTKEDIYKLYIGLNFTKENICNINK